MSDTHIENAIIQAIEIVAGKRIEQAGYDRTYIATINSVLDATCGKYEIKYQDSLSQAYATSSNVHYSQGDQVFVLVPRNNPTRVKTIINGIKNNATTYNEIQPEKQLYNQIGPNAIGNDIISLSSYGESSFDIYQIETATLFSKYKEIAAKYLGQGNEIDYEDKENYNLIYNLIRENQDKTQKEIRQDLSILDELNLVGQTSTFNWNLARRLIDIDQDIAKRYIRQSNGLAIGMDVQTRLASSQVGGNYGLIFTLKFEDNKDNSAAVRSYIVDARDVIGNPYALTKVQTVEHLFSDIDTAHFVDIERVTVFCRDFPKDESKTDIYDIFFSNIKFNGADVLYKEDLENYFLNIDYSTNGNILYEIQASVKNDDQEETNIQVIGNEDWEFDPQRAIKLIAQLKINGKIITQNVSYYWFRQNGLVFKGNQKYSPFGGDGWECLNNFDNNTAIPQYDGNFYFTNLSSMVSEKPLCIKSEERVTKIKCVAVSGKINQSSVISVIDQNINAEITISSSDKKQSTEENKVDYYLDAGSPTLTCLIKEPEYVNQEHQYSYVWSIIPAKGKSELNKNTEDINGKYKKAKQEWDRVSNYLNKLAQTDKQVYARTDDYLTAKNNIENIKNQPRVQGNIFYNFPISSVTNYSKIVCSVMDSINGEEPVYRGSASIILYNHMQIQGMYSLNIENGVQVFQYDRKGNSPASEILQKPLEIKPLSFSFFDNEGVQISFDQIITNGYVEWHIPKNNTLLASNQEENKKIINSYADKGAVIASAADFNVYRNIPSFYYTIANNYDVKKRQNYIKLDVKYKDIILSGYTNFTFPKDGDPGTNGTDFVAKIVPDSSSTDRVYISNINPNVLFDDNGKTINTLNFEFYNNSIKIEDNKNNLWTCPPNKTENAFIKRKSLLSIATPKDDNLLPDYTKCLVTKKGTYDPNSSEYPIDIVRVQHGTGDDLRNYAEYPICVNQVVAKEFDNSSNFIPYRFKIRPKTGFNYVVYAEDGTSPDYDNTLPFEAVVELYQQHEPTRMSYYVQQSDITVEWNVIGNLQPGETTSDYKYYCSPAQNFNGSDLTSAVVATFKKDGQIIGYLHVPIYMIINRYGHSALNDWDGNSIQLNANGDTILAPQVGAGKKNQEDNTFTGILMGIQHTTPRSSQDQEDFEQVGLFGYHRGERSIFLDSQTGKAVFGKNNSGQITMDPSLKIVTGVENPEAEDPIYETVDAGLLYSGNYVLPDTESVKTRDDIDGTTIVTVDAINLDVADNYNATEGMVIDLSTPQIGFGSGNFYVTKDGYIHAGGGGDIAGWHVSDNQLVSQSSFITTEGDKQFQTTQITGIASSGVTVENIWPGGGGMPTPTASVAFYAGMEKKEIDMTAQPSAGDGEYGQWTYLGDNPWGKPISTIESEDEEPGADPSHEDPDPIKKGSTYTIHVIKNYQNNIPLPVTIEKNGLSSSTYDVWLSQENEEERVIPGILGTTEYRFYDNDDKSKSKIYTFSGWSPQSKILKYSDYTSSSTEYTENISFTAKWNIDSNTKLYYDTYTLYSASGEEIPEQVIKNFNIVPKVGYRNSNNDIVGGYKLGETIYPTTQHEERVSTATVYPEGENSLLASTESSWKFNRWIDESKIAQGSQQAINFLGEVERQINKNFYSVYYKYEYVNAGSRVPQIIRNYQRKDMKFAYEDGQTVAIVPSSTYERINWSQDWTYQGWRLSTEAEDVRHTDNTTVINGSGLEIINYWKKGVPKAQQSSHNFYITHDGYFYSQYGRIATWDINENAIENENVGIGTSVKPLGFRFNPKDGKEKVQSINSPRIWAGNDEKHDGKDCKNFIVTDGGELYTRMGQIGPWTINGDALSDNDDKSQVGMGTKDLPLKADDDEGYFGKDGFVAKFWSLTSPKSDNNFAVSRDGKLYASGGKIGGWNITRNQLYSGNPEDNENGIRISASGGINGGTKNGNKWSISSDGRVSFNYGNIGGWTINDKDLTSAGSNITLNSSGSILGPKNNNNGRIWQITSDGDAYFSMIHGVVASTNGDTSLSAGSPSFGSNGVQMMSNGNFHAGNGSGGITYSNGITTLGSTSDGWIIDNDKIKSSDENVYISSSGLIQLGDGGTTITGGNVIAKSGFGFVQGSSHTLGRSGVLEFSDGSKLTFKSGLLWAVTRSTDAEVKWNGDNL